jgi:hypothetical protein
MFTEYGRTEERIARIQERYIAQATSSWLESLERSVTQMKDYQVCDFLPFSADPS